MTDVRARRPTAEARRATLLGAAIKVIARQGFSGASLREMASEAGMEKGHITYYYRTKDDLLYEIVDTLHQRFLDDLDGWVLGAAGAGPHDVLARVFHAHVLLVCEFRLQTRVSYESMRFLSEPRRKAVAAKRRAYQRRVAAIIDTTRTGDEVAPTTVVVSGVLGMLNWTYHWYDPSGRSSAGEIATWLAEQALASVRGGYGGR